MVIDGDVRELEAELLMQYNPKMFDIRVFENNGRVEYSKTKVLSYKDESYVCQRKVELGAG